MFRLGYYVLLDKGWNATQLCGDYFISQDKNPYQPTGISWNFHKGLVHVAYIFLYFQRFFIFAPTWEDDANWFIFFDMKLPNS